MRGSDPLSPGPRPAEVATVDLSLHFEGLAHPTRLRIVERLGAVPELRVSQLAEFCKVSQPRMSWHLRMLRRAELIRTRREGREVFCRLDREAIAEHLRSFVRLLGQGVGADVGDRARTQPVPSVQQIPVSEVAK